MEKVSGVVLEKQNNLIVILTDTGEFRKVKVTGRTPEIGEEVRVPAHTRRTWAMPKFGWIAAAAAVLLFMLVSPLVMQYSQPPETAVAWVTIDINPSIELAVSKTEKVLAARAINKDGERILSLVEVENLKVDEAVSEITTQAKKLGYIGKSKDNRVLFGFTYLPNTHIDRYKLQKTLLASAQEVLQADTADSKLQTVNVSPELREKAVAKKITAGKYAVLIEAVAKYNLNVTEEDMKEKSVAKAITDAGGQVDEVLDKAQEEKEFDKNEEKQYLQIASIRRTEALTAAKPTGETQNTPGVKDDKDTPESDNKKPEDDHRNADKTRDDNKDSESVADNTYKNNQDNQNNDGNNSSTGNQTNESPKPPAQPGQNGSQTPESGEPGRQQDTGNYILLTTPVDDKQMAILKPNF